jgi:hypothetical protein
MRGTGSRVTNIGAGILLRDGVGINSGTGRIIMDARGSSWVGLEIAPFDGNKVSTITSAAAGGTAISIYGSSESSGGVLMLNRSGFGSAAGYRILATGSGGISITGRSNTQTAVSIGGADIHALSGPIDIDAGLRTLELVSSKIGGLTTDANLALRPSSANITITSNMITMSNDVVSTTGTVTIQPVVNSSFATAFSIPSTFTFSQGISGITGLTLGRAGNTSAVTVSSALDVNGPIWIYGDAAINANMNAGATGAGIYVRANGDATLAANLSANGPIDITANNIFVRGNITKTIGSSGIVSLVAKDRIQLDNSRTITSNGSEILLAANSDATGGGSIWVDRSSILSGGGLITLGGGDALGSGYAEGSAGAGPTAYDARYRGILLNQATINGGGGNIVMRGRGWMGANTITTDQFAIGIDFVGFTGGSTVTTSGAGTITMTGLGGVNYKSTTHGVGINFYNGLSGAPFNTISSGAGAISITGTYGTGIGLLFSGINVDAQTINITSTSGPITLTGNAQAGNFGIRNAGTMNIGWTGSGTPTTGAIKLISDRYSFGSTSVNGSGSLTFESVGASFLDAFNTTSLTTGTTFTGLTIGKTTNAQAITIGRAASVAGPVRIYGSNVTISSALSSGTAEMFISATGAVTQSAAISGGELVLDRGGSFTLNNVGNAFTTLTAGLTGTPIGSLDYIDANALTIGSVTSQSVTYSGITSTGTVSVATQLGNLTVSNNIATTSTNATSAVILNAGRNASVVSSAPAVGADTAGELLVGNGVTITTGTGGRATLYTGQVVNANLLALAGSASSRFRYGSDETTSRFTTALGSGLHVVYREQPEIDLGGATQTITYGDAPVLTSSVVTSNVLRPLYNGDTANAVAPSVGNAEVRATSNNALVSVNGLGVYNAGTYNLVTPTPASSALGYKFTSGSSTLTVSKKALTATVNDSSKNGGQADPVGYAGVTLVGLLTGENANTLMTGSTITRPVGEAAGTYALTLNNFNPANYVVTARTGVFTILTTDTVQVTLGSSSANYGGSVTYSRPAVEISGQTLTFVSQSGDSFTYRGPTAGDTVTFTVTNNGTANSNGHVNIGTYSLVSGVFSTQGIYASGNQIIRRVEVTGNLTVLPKPVTVTALDGSAISKVYDGSTDLNSVIKVNTGVLIGQTSVNETLNHSGAVANSKDVGTGNYLSNITLLNATGTATNYALPALNVTNVGVTINRRPITFTVARLYDGSTDVTSTVALGNLVSGESLTVTTAAANTARAGVSGTHVASATLTNSSGMVSNYTIQNKTLVSGTAITGLTAGAGNAVTITPRPVTPTLSLADASKVYDSTTTGPTSVATRFAVAGAIAGDTVSLASTGSVYNAATVAGASSLTVSGITVGSVSGGSGSVASDYVVSSATLTTAAAITKAALAVTADNATKVYGGVNPTLAYAIGGFVGGQDLASSGVSGAATVSTTATATTSVGNVAITPAIGSLAAANYSFNFVNPGGRERLPSHRARSRSRPPGFTMPERVSRPRSSRQPIL